MWLILETLGLEAGIQTGKPVLYQFIARHQAHTFTVCTHLPHLKENCSQSGDNPSDFLSYFTMYSSCKIFNIVYYCSFFSFST